MKINDKQLFGRTQAISWLRRQVFAGGDGWTSPPVLLVHGDEGIGKTALVEAFLHEYTGLGSGHSAVSFFWKGNMRVPSLGAFMRMLLRSGRANIPGLNDRKEPLNKALEDHPDLHSPVGQSSDTYTINGATRERGHAVMQPIGRDEGGLADEFVAILVDWLETGCASGAVRPKLMSRLVFVFDDFETYPTTIKSWLGRHLFPAMEKAVPLPPFVSILTGRQSWETGEQADYWSTHPASFRQLRLNPLTRHDCEEWLRTVGMEVELADLVFEQTEGNPLRLQQALCDKDWQERQRTKGIDPDNHLSCFNLQQLRWLHAASLSPSISLETLQLLLGRVEGVQAFGWLSSHIEFCQVETDPHHEHLLVLSSEMRKSVERWLLPVVPMRNREFKARLSLMKEIKTKVNHPIHRGNLRILTPIQPFNRQLLEELFNEPE